MQTQYSKIYSPFLVKYQREKKNNLDKAISKMIFINFALGANVTVHPTELGKACNTVAYAPLSS